MQLNSKSKLGIYTESMTLFCNQTIIVSLDFLNANMHELVLHSFFSPTSTPEVNILLVNTYILLFLCDYI